MSDRLAIAVILAVVGIHSFYWFSGGPDFGARYWFLMLVPCVALTIRGAQLVASRFQPVGTGKISVGCTIILLSAMALTNFFVWRAVDKYHDYRGMRPDMRELAKEHEFGKSIVLVRGKNHPDYASAAVYNPVNFAEDVPIYAWDRGGHVRDALIRAYPNRPMWIVHGPSVTHSGYQIVRRPVMLNTPVHARTSREPSGASSQYTHPASDGIRSPDTSRWSSNSIIPR